MSNEAMLELPAFKIGKQNPKLGENLFFATKEATVKRNEETLKFLATVAGQFPFDSVIRKDLTTYLAESKKNPALLASMKTTVGVEQIDSRLSRKKINGDAIYSVKLEVNGATSIFTLRVGKDFTELSLVKDGKFVEILREEKGETTHEKF